MERAARITGYACVLAILIIAFRIVGLAHQEIARSTRVIRVSFPVSGTLLAEDPVVQKGVPIGRVRSLSLQGGAALAEIELFQRELFIPSDSRFIDFNYSLMGARMVALYPGRSRIPMDESRIQFGAFADGVGEAIHRVKELLGLMADLRAATGRLSSEPNSPLSPKFSKRLEKNTGDLNRLAERISREGNSLQTQLEIWKQTAGSFHMGLTSASPALDASENRIETLLNEASSAERRADAVLASAERVLASINDSGGMTHALLYDRTAYDELLVSLHILETSLQTFRNKGLNGAVKWRNLHFFR